LTDPFQQLHGRAAAEVLTPLETTYSNYEALVQRGKGGVYRAVDHSCAPAKPVVIKEGRRHGETDWLGRDGFYRTKREARVLKSASSLVPALPRIITTFRANGCFYLVVEPIAGRSLLQIIGSHERVSTRRILDYSKRMAQIMADVHAAGWAWRDCKPGNFFSQKNHEIRALDFEGACRLRKVEPIGLSTAGYFPPKSHAKSRDLEAMDLYALGTSIMQLIARRNTPTRLGPAFDREIRKRKLPRSIAGTIRSLRSSNPQARPSARAAQRLFEKLLESQSRGML
jgi:serine/threonine protein kinase